MKKLLLFLVIPTIALGTALVVSDKLTYSATKEGVLVMDNPSIAVDFEFEEGNPLGDSDVRVGTTSPKHQLTWAGILRACTDPGHYNNQVPPRKITVNCKKKVCQWETKVFGSVLLKRRTWFGSNVMTSKTNIHMHKKYWKGPKEPGTDTVPCTKFGYYCGKDTLSTTMGCMEALEITDLKAYCEGQFMDIGEELDTDMILQGKEIHSCPGIPGGGHTQW